MWVRRPRASKAAEVRRPARLLGEAGDGGPVDAGVADRVERHLVGVDEQVGRDRVAVEVEREVVGREDLAEGHRRRRAVDGGDEAVVDAEVLQRLVDVAAERVASGARDERGAVAVARGRDGDVGRAAAEELLEGAHLLEADAVLERIDVDARAPDGDDVVCRGARLRRSCVVVVVIASHTSHRLGISSRETGRPSWRDSSHASATRKAWRASSTVQGEGSTPRATAAKAVSSAR